MVVFLVPPSLIIKPLDKPECRLLSCGSTLVELVDEIGSDDRHVKGVTVNREVMMREFNLMLATVLEWTWLFTTDDGD